MCLYVCGLTICHSRCRTVNYWYVPKNTVHTAIKNRAAEVLALILGFYLTFMGKYYWCLNGSLCMKLLIHNLCFIRCVLINFEIAQTEIARKQWKILKKKSHIWPKSFCTREVVVQVIKLHFTKLQWKTSFPRYLQVM